MPVGGRADPGLCRLAAVPVGGRAGRLWRAAAVACGGRAGRRPLWPGCHCRLRPWQADGGGTGGLRPWREAATAWSFRGVGLLL